MITHLAAGSGDTLLDWLKNNASAVGILSFLVISFIRGWIVPGEAHKKTLAERDRAIDMIYDLADAARRAVEVAERKP